MGRFHDAWWSSVSSVSFKAYWTDKEQNAVRSTTVNVGSNFKDIS
jgi:hypothetical protein